jgi:hypothetical protein
VARGGEVQDGQATEAEGQIEGLAQKILDLGQAQPGIGPFASTGDNTVSFFIDQEIAFIIWAAMAEQGRCLMEGRQIYWLAVPMPDAHNAAHQPRPLSALEDMIASYSPFIRAAIFSGSCHRST